MISLTIQGRQALLSNASDIYTYKCMLSIAYKYLTSQAGDEITKDLLLEMSLNEVMDADIWNRVIETIH